MSEKKTVTQSWLSAIDDNVDIGPEARRESLRDELLRAPRRALPFKEEASPGCGEGFPPIKDTLKFGSGDDQPMEEGPLPLWVLLLPLRVLLLPSPADFCM